jgi:hypothetical protein
MSVTKLRFHPGKCVRRLESLRYGLVEMHNRLVDIVHRSSSRLSDPYSAELSIDLLFESPAEGHRRHGTSPGFFVLEGRLLLKIRARQKSMPTRFHERPSEEREVSWARILLLERLTERWVNRPKGKLGHV